MSASFVLASLRGSTYKVEYASPLRSLRPCWTAFLNILRESGPALPKTAEPVPAIAILVDVLQCSVTVPFTGQSAV